MCSALLDPSLEFQSWLKGEPLIPGLPDEVALHCLLQIPVDHHINCRVVCKQWYSLFGSKERFFTLRKELGFHDPWLFVFAFNKSTGKMMWKVFDLYNFSWHTIPAMPYKEKLCPRGFRCIALPREGVLYVCGGVASDDCSLNVVLKYEVRKNHWTVMKKMINARSFFASGVIKGMIYVAGGNNTDLYNEINSAEVLDPDKETWHPVANMGVNMALYESAVLNGKLLTTEGWYWPFLGLPRGQIYDPKTNNWEEMASGLREGWTGPSVVIYEHLFVVSEHERTKLKVYDTETDSWDIVEGLPLPEQICKPFSVDCYGNQILIVGRDLHIAVGHITRLQQKNQSGKNCSFAVTWQVIDAPESLTDFSPSSAQVVFA